MQVIATRPAHAEYHPIGFNRVAQAGEWFEHERRMVTTETQPSAHKQPVVYRQVWK